MKTPLILTAFFFTAVVPAFGQNGVPADSALRMIGQLYNAARYVDAELEARRLREVQGLGDSATVQADQWIAFSLIAQGKTTAARERFIMALKLDPGFDLDPVLTSPKILTVFNDARSEFNALRRSSADSAHPTAGRNFRPLTYRTIVFPGWEQFHHGRTTAGSVFLGAGAVTLGAGVTFEILRSNARDEYLKSVTASDISSKYDRYDTYRKAEIYSFVAFALVYIASEIDVLSEYQSRGITISSGTDPSAGRMFTVSIHL